jgi:hypothetical protein
VEEAKIEEKDPQRVGNPVMKIRQSIEYMSIKKDIIR